MGFRGRVSYPGRFWHLGWVILGHWAAFLAFTDLLSIAPSHLPPQLWEIFTDTAKCSLGDNIENCSRGNSRLASDDVAQTENFLYPIHPSGEDKARFCFSSIEKVRYYDSGSLMTCNEGNLYVIALGSKNYCVSVVGVSLHCMCRPKVQNKGDW